MYAAQTRFVREMSYRHSQAHMNELAERMMKLRSRIEDRVADLMALRQQQQQQQPSTQVVILCDTLGTVCLVPTGGGSEGGESVSCLHCAGEGTTTTSEAPGRAQT